MCLKPITQSGIHTAPSTSATSSPLDSSRQDMLTIDQLPTCNPQTSTDSINATSSQGSADGPTPCASPDGMTLDLFGQEVAPANPSQPQVQAKHLEMNATSGPSGSNLSEQFDRQSSLANKLKRQLDGVGSTLFTLTWKRRATPLGRPYYQLVASGPRTSDNDFGSWATPQSDGTENSLAAHEARAQRAKLKHGRIFGNPLGVQAQMASWGTPNAAVPGGTPEQALARKRKARAQGKSMGLVVSVLDHQVQMASWPTPNVPNGGRSIAHTEMKGSTAYHKGKKVQVDLGAVVKMTSWPSPRAMDGSKGAVSETETTQRRVNDGKANLAEGSQSLASWATPQARDWKDSGDLTNVADGTHQMNLPREAWNVIGPISSGSPAQTASKGQLNPAFSLWLMGYPPEWLNCAPLAMPSSRKSRQSSSAPATKP